MPDQPKDPVDPKSFLLPKAPVKPLEKKSSDLPSESGQTFPPTVLPTSTPAPAPKKEETMVHAVETYTTDINRVMESGNVSTITIAAAEAERRAKGAKEEPGAPAQAAGAHHVPTRLVLIMAGVLLILGAFGIVAVLVLGAAPAPATPAATTDSSLMTVDQTVTVYTTANTIRDTLITDLETAREQVSLSVGLVAQLYVGIPTTTSTMPEQMTINQLLSTLAPNIPPDLLRAIEPTYLLGVHSYDENQTFLVLRVDSYQQAYAGMLAWEETMQQDLSPLFTRHPSPHLPAGTATTTATSSPEFLKTGFADQTVENHDARVVLSGSGDILLLWTFLDRNTLVITTDEYTLREIIRRLNTSSLVPQPQQ